MQGRQAQQSRSPPIAGTHRPKPGTDKENIFALAGGGVQPVETGDQLPAEASRGSMHGRNNMSIPVKDTALVAVVDGGQNPSQVALQLVLPHPARSSLPQLVHVRSQIAAAELRVHECISVCSVGAAAQLGVEAGR
jgi:hypothetical protein